MDQSLMSMSQFAHMNLPPIPQGVQTKFNATMTVSALPKILAYSQCDQGNVMLYESNKTTLLLVLPPGMSITIPGIKLSDRPLPIVGGEKTGYVFSKFQPQQLEELDRMLGSEWKNQLSEPLPAPVIAKTPVLLCRTNIAYNGHQVPASLWEYSDKSLVVFAPMDFSGGNDKLMKPFNPLVCPDLPPKPDGKPGSCSGYMIYKGTPNMVNFAKQHFQVPFETMYTKSPPVHLTPIAVQREPVILETKAFLFNNQQVTMEFVESSPLALAMFPSPMIALDGFDMKELYHPCGTKRPGYLIAKSQKDKITMIQQYFGLSDLESMYTMTEEVSARATAIQPLPVGSAQSKGFSDLSINSFDDIPLSTLLRLIQVKLKASVGVVNKNEISGQVLIYGDGAKVDADAAFLDDMETSIQVICGDKMAVFLIPTSVQ